MHHVPHDGSRDSHARRLRSRRQIPFCAAVEKALPPLVKAADGHMAERTCFACHNQALPILAYTIARDRGLAVPEWDLSEQLDFIAEFLGRNRDQYRKGNGQGGQADTAGYALSDAGTRRLQAGRDDRGRRRIPHPPRCEIESLAVERQSTAVGSEQFCTNLFGDPGTEEMGHAGAGRTGREADRGGPRLAGQDAGEGHRGSRLSTVGSARPPGPMVESGGDELVKAQRPDGGWAQTEADGERRLCHRHCPVRFASQGGAMSPADRPIAAASNSCLKTQRADGTWHVAREANRSKATSRPGFPHGKDQFISLGRDRLGGRRLALTLPPMPRHPVIVTGKAAGGYAAFPDICRTKVGRPALRLLLRVRPRHFAVEGWPNGGRIMATRSGDDGRTWSSPAVIFDTPFDDRDPHVAALRDGTLICNWFVTARPPAAIEWQTARRLPCSLDGRRENLVRRRQR